ncbi:hypothetical protein V6Z93_004145 [Aspergillus fumigatus]
MTSIKSNIPYAPHRVGNCSVDFDTPDDFQKFCRSMTKSRAIKGSSVDLGVHDGTRNKIKQIKGASREASLGHWASHAAGKKPARSVR